MRILFIIPSFHIGGTNKVLLSIIAMTQQQHECSVFSLDYETDPLNIKEQCCVLPKRLVFPRKSNKSAFRERDIVALIENALFGVMRRLGKPGVRGLFVDRTVRYLESMEYDLVVGMEEGLATELASHVKVDLKIAWIHCDYSRYLLLRNSPDETEVYKRFNSIVCVSEYTAQVFRNSYPQLADKVKALYNPIDTESIVAKSQESLPATLKVEDHGCLIVSIGRLDPVKRFANIPEIAAKLKKRGLNFTWYVVGDGEEKQAILDNVSKYDVFDQVLMTGSLSNPYPLLRKAKLLVILSESEACPIVIQEAMLLSVPVITTDYPTASEFIENNVNGLIVSLKNVADTIYSILNNPTTYSSLIHGIQQSKINYDERYRKIISHVSSLVGA